MSEQYKEIVYTVDLDKVMRFYAEQFKVRDKAKMELTRVDHFVDVSKGKVAFVLCMKEKGQ